MGTITERKRQDGSIAFTAQIRLTRDGEKHSESKTFTNRKKAESWIVLREQQLEAGLPSNKIVLIKDLIESAIADAEPSSRVRSLSHLLRYDLSQVNVQTMTVQSILAFIKVRTTEVAPATIQFDLSQLRSVLIAAQTEEGLTIPIESFDQAFNYAKSKGWISPSKKRQRRVSREEEQRLVEYFNQSRRVLPMADLVQFAVNSGRRLEEITKLRWEDLSVEQKTLIVRDMKHPKRKKGNDHKSRLTPEALEIILRQPKTSEFIFPYNHKSIGTAFYYTTRLLGIEDLHFHDLRHEAVSRLFERGYAIHEVALFSLHKDWMTLQRYTHLRAEDIPDK